ncbi:basic salivary proline-rich protein 2-like [Myotis daubentonii]|uniref:basic salivary proline-rich protein 2-like n=1 Tax=Myotis daubentonii TaxID=98922 RepID=UPI00287351A2|nr:basic salivary proline-rich protein 2-like [Myotis daubentonii]
MVYTGMPCGFQKRDFPTTKAQRKVPLPVPPAFILTGMGRLLRSPGANLGAGRLARQGSDLRPGTGWVWFGFVSKSPGDDSGNLNFKIAGARANPDFPERTLDVLSAEGAPRTRRGATPPHAIRGRPAHSGRKSGTPPVPRPRQRWGLETGPRESSSRSPAPSARSRTPGPAWFVGRRDRHDARDSRPQLRPNPGQVLAPQGPALPARGPPPPPLASSCSPYSPPLAPPVEPGGLSPQRGRREAGLAGAELLPGLPDPPRLRALPTSQLCSNPQGPRTRSGK